MKLGRLSEIEQYIITNQTVSLDKLCEVFAISKNTVRRDIADLVKRGTVKKVYGGVTAIKNALVPFAKRNIKNKGEKEAIARAAARYVQDGDIIYIDSGTTVPNMINYIPNKHITVLTESLNATINALPHENINVIMLGGTLVRNTNSLSIMNPSILKNYNINKAFMASTGISIENGVTNSSPLEFEIKKEVAEKSGNVYLMVDHSKFGAASLLTYCPLAAVSGIITDQTPSKDYLDFIQSRHIELTVADSAD